MEQGGAYYSFTQDEWDALGLGETYPGAYSNGGTYYIPAGDYNPDDYYGIGNYFIYMRSNQAGG